MAGRKAVGLDIGTSAVRAAELSTGRGGHTLERFGQVALPVGAVVDGEVLDRDAVTAALKTLWSQTRFSTKRVVLGVDRQHYERRVVLDDKIRKLRLMRRHPAVDPRVDLGTGKGRLPAGHDVAGDAAGIGHQELSHLFFCSGHVPEIRKPRATIECRRLLLALEP